MRSPRAAPRTTQARALRRIGGRPGAAVARRIRSCEAPGGVIDAESSYPVRVCRAAKVSAPGPSFAAIRPIRATVTAGGPDGRTRAPPPARAAPARPRPATAGTPRSRTRTTSTSCTTGTSTTSTRTTSTTSTRELDPADRHLPHAGHMHVHEDGCGHAAVPARGPRRLRPRRPPPRRPPRPLRRALTRGSARRRDANRRPRVLGSDLRPDVDDLRRAVRPLGHDEAPAVLLVRVAHEDPERLEQAVGRQDLRARARGRPRGAPGAAPGRTRPPRRCRGWP